MRDARRSATRMVANLRNVDEDLAAAGRRRPRPARAARGAAEPAASPITDLPAVAGAEHPRQRPGTLRRPQARRARHRRHRRGAARGAAQGGRRAEARASSSSSPRRSAASTLERRQLHRRRDQKIDGGPSVLYDAVAILASADGAAALGRRPGGARTSSPTPSPTASSSATPTARGPLLDAAGVGGRPTTASSAWTSTPPPTSSPAAPSCGSGPARPPSPSGPARRRHPPAKADRRNHGTSGHRPSHRAIRGQHARHLPQ